MNPTLSFLLKRFVCITHRTKRPLPYPYHLIHQQVLRHGVGDEQHRHFALELVDRGGEVFGGVGVQAAGGFVEDEYLGLFDEGSCDGHALLLSAGESDTAFADLGLVALRQGFDGAVDFGHFAGMHDLVEGGVRVGHHEVVVEGAGEEDGFLRHDAEVVAQFVGREVADVVAVDLDGAA